MVKQEVKLTWDGETIKHVTSIPDIKVTPKDMLNALDQAEGQFEEMKQQKVKLEQNLEVVKKNLVNIKDFIKERTPFKDKCTEIQIQKLKNCIIKISDECKVKAIEISDATINKDSNAYTLEQKNNMYYVNYQRLLATNEIVANKIGAKIISKHLFEDPIFDNPFVI